MRLKQKELGYRNVMALDFCTEKSSQVLQYKIFMSRLYCFVRLQFTLCVKRHKFYDVTIRRTDSTGSRFYCHFKRPD